MAAGTPLTVGGVRFNSTETSPEPALATARSGLASPLRCPIATELELLPVGKLTAAANEPVPVPSNTDTSPESEPELATARSGLASPFRSPPATEAGKLPAAKLVAGANEPVPVPSNTDTSPESGLATARSGLA